MTKPALPLVGSHAETLPGGALDDRFGIVRLRQAADVDALIAAHGNDIAAALTNRFDEAMARLREAAVRNLVSVLDGSPVVNEVMG